MPSFKVTPDQLTGLGGTVRRVSADVRGEHGQLRAQLEPLFGVEWAGPAAAQFTALYGEFDQHAKGLSDALDGISRLLQTAGVHYADTESQIAASFR